VHRLAGSTLQTTWEDDAEQSADGKRATIRVDWDEGLDVDVCLIAR